MDVETRPPPAPAALERVSCSFDAKSSHRFAVALGTRSYTRQYSHVYNKRALALRAPLAAAAKKKWPGVKAADRLVAAAEAPEGSRMVVTGTTFKAMPGRPDVLDEYRSLFGEADGANKEQPASYASPDDTVVLEDESGRLKLLGVDVATLVTGLPFAALGARKGDAFVVEDWVGCGFPPARAAAAPAGDGPKLLLVSGLARPEADADADAAAAARFELLEGWLAGRLSSDEEASTVVRRVARSLVVGDAVGVDADAAARARDRSARALAGTQPKAADDAVEACLGPVKAADARLARLAALCPTAALPGPRDPTSFALPQQPLHPLLLPTANRFPAFCALPNPAEADVAGRVVLAHAGQPVRDWLRHSDYEAAAAQRGDGAARAFRDGSSAQNRHVDGGGSDAWLACLEDALWWRHVAPTAPDSLAAYPFSDEDPFVVDEVPDVLVSGDAPAFATSVATRADGSAAARVVCLPSFAATGVCALVDLATLEVERLEFSDDTMADDDAMAVDAGASA